MAELVRSHLDAMARTDGEPEWNRDRYTMAVTNEALAFLEHYPERKDELVRRLREGRITLSPFLNNTLWGWQSEEAFLRSLYPARRLERAWGVPIDVAHHTELPSLPWGAATLLAGAGVRWLAVPFLDYDTEWGGLEVPPLFVLEGPDGGRVRVVLDAWASRRHNYTQGRALLEDPKRIGAEWLPRFEALGAAYPFRDVLALGTHGDLGPQSAGEVERFTAAIRDWNAQAAPPARLVNATLAGFCRSIDAAEASRALPTLRGDLGHSWEAWPVTLAALAGAARQAEREMLAAEALAALAGGDALAAATRERRESAEWSWAMLGDHAWNGTDDANRLENASLRRRWADTLVDTARDLAQRAWAAAGLVDRTDVRDALQPDRRRAPGRRPLPGPARPVHPRGPRRRRPRPAQPAGPRGRAAGSLLRPAPPRRVLHDDPGPRHGRPATPHRPPRDAHEPRRPLLPAHRGSPHRRPREPRAQGDRPRARRRRTAHPRPDRLLRRERGGGRGVRERGRDDRPGARPPPPLVPDRPRGDGPLRHALRPRRSRGPRLPRAQAGGRRRGAARPRLPRRRARRAPCASTRRGPSSGPGPRPRATS